jgi:DNA repair protein RecN (Recombination protein N)
MLDEITVSNLGLIESASISFTEGLTVVTGETGAGKTLMLGALRLLKGETASKDVIGPHGDSAEVSALVEIDGADVVLRRVVNPSKSKAYIDGQISPAKALAEIAGSHIAIVGQHDQHTITSSVGVRTLVDRCLDAEGRKAFASYTDAWVAYQGVLAQAEALGGDLRTLERDVEMLRFQVEEIDGAGFVPGDEEDLRATAARLRSSEELATEIDRAITELGDHGIGSPLGEAVRAIEKAARVDPSLDGTAAQANDLGSLVNELLTDLARYASDLSSDDTDLGLLERRLATLGDLKRKYGDTIDDIVTFRKNAAVQVDELLATLDSASDIEERLASAHNLVVTAGSALRAGRVKASTSMSVTARDHLKNLGFSDPLVSIDVTEREPRRSGCDRIDLLFASDAALTAAPVSSVASGGELSRLVLALTLAAGGAEAAIVAFDEIDAGIGGSTALAMGEKLATLAGGRQVICVTHLPQVAAFGSTHLVVSRDGTITSVSEVTGQDRVIEITRMLAGLGDSDTGQRHAEELLARATMRTANGAR